MPVLGNLLKTFLFALSRKVARLRQVRQPLHQLTSTLVVDDAARIFRRRANGASAGCWILAALVEEDDVKFLFHQLRPVHVKPIHHIDDALVDVADLLEARLLVARELRDMSIPRSISLLFDQLRLAATHRHFAESFVCLSRVLQLVRLALLRYNDRVITTVVLQLFYIAQHGLVLALIGQQQQLFLQAYLDDLQNRLAQQHFNALV